MRDTLYVIVNRQRIERTAKTDNFNLNPGERAFRLVVEIEDEAFATPQIPTIRMSIPMEQLFRPLDITLEGEPE
jgi:hypothetical protein